MVEFGNTDGDVKGDKQTEATSDILKKLCQEDQFNAFCIDCQKNRSTHANVTFGVFICQDCATFHIANFPMYDSYIKAVFDECWDEFQLRMVMQGGNKKFFEYMKSYEKEREPILKKYTSSAACYYRKKLCFEAKRVPFDELAPPKNVKEFADHAGKKISTHAVAVGSFVSEQEAKYKIGEKTGAAASATKNAILGLWNKTKDAINAPPQNQPEDFARP